MKPERKKQLRCAIYTRVSTEYGLEQEFNSLDAQRESSEAFTKSQAHEGWRALRTRYDDGGFSGASLQRPALQQLLADIRNGLVDVVVVYKVDRLTRSLADFAKLVELFDAHGVSFVSVTQAFNTTNSMGRLTLNVLLSFAQFEREVTGERIRDKVAASRRKGIWMGGNVPLGYEVREKKLVINEEEAEAVRTIFQRYVELRSLNDLLRDLRQRAILSKRVVRSNGRVRGGICFTRGPLACLLKNRVYIGEAVHKGKHYPGEHEPILERRLFEAVQQALAAQRQARLQYRINNQSLLTGKIFDDRGNRMTPATAKKGAARYRYYVSAALHQGRTNEAGSIRRVPAPEIETVVLEAITKALTRAGSPSGAVGPAHDPQRIESHLQKVVVRKNQLEISLAELESGSEPLLLQWSPPPTRRAREIIAPAGHVDARARPVRWQMRARLVEAIATRRRWVEDLISGKVTSVEEIAKRKRCSPRAVRMTLSLAFLSPTIVKAAIDGTLPHGCGLIKLADTPAGWEAQKQVVLG
jgi:DNA invertase Pin-like site-specific DNA recombinase